MISYAERRPECFLPSQQGRNGLPMIRNGEKQMKKTGIILCIVGGILVVVGLVMIAFAMGQRAAVGSDSVNPPQIQSSSEGRGDSAGDISNASETTDRAEQTEASESSKEASESSEEALESSQSAEQNLSEGSETGEEDLTQLAAPSVCGKLSVKGTELVDEQGRPVQLRGVSTHGIGWFPAYVDQNTFRELRNNWNVNVVRLAMYTHENQGYCTDGNQENLKNIIYRGVQYATDNDLYVIIDWHVLQDQNPNKYLSQAKDFFKLMSEKYKDNNNVIYEICNEPNGGTTWKDVKSYAEEIIPIIRENDKDAIILVGSPEWSQRVDQAAQDPITGYDNIMYTLHFYAGTHKDDLRNRMVKAIEKGLPIFVSEYGICDASGNGALDLDSAAKWVEVMDEHNVSYVCWSMANKNESSALFKSSCSKNCNFEENDLNESGKWLYNLLTGKTPAKGSNTGTGNSGNTQNNNTSSESKGESFTSAGLEGTVTLKSKWESGGKTCYQYDLSLTNPGDQSLKGWAIDIHFSDNVELDSSWGGKFTANGNTLHVVSESYNEKLDAGGTLKDLGFIITGPGGLTVTK